MKNQITKYLSYSFFFVTLLINPISAENQKKDYSKIILTKEKISELGMSIHTTKKKLWESTRISADNFIMSESLNKIKPTNEFRYSGETIPALALAYLLLDDDKYLTYSLKWIEALLSIPNWGNDDGNLLRASWSIGLALEYNWLYNYLDDELKERIQNRLLYEGEIIKETASKYRALSNHLLIETSTLGIIGLVLSQENKESEKLLEQADDWAKYIIRYAPEDGSWGEGILYWQYGLRYFLIFLESAESVGYNNYYSDYDWLKKTGYFAINFLLPTSKPQVINFSDCSSQTKIPAYIFYHLASKYNNGHFQFMGNKMLNKDSYRYSWMDLIQYNSNITSADIKNLPTLRHFEDTGFITMRSDWSNDATVIGFRCGPAVGHRNQSDSTRISNFGFGPGHGHPDVNSFSLFANGTWLAIDPGYTYKKETRNHNTVVVNNYGQVGEGGKWLDYMAFESREPAPSVLKVESNNIFDYVIGDAGNLYDDKANLKYFRRHLLFLKPNILLVADELVTKSESNFEWLLNAKELITKKDTNIFEIQSGKAKLNINLILPQNGISQILERKIKASDLLKIPNEKFGIIRTLNFKVENEKSTDYIVALSVQSESDAEVPSISLENENIIIESNNDKWIIRYNLNGKKEHPLFIVEEPKPFQTYYSFTK